MMDKQLKEYLKARFLRNNHNKYAKYCEEWINGITEDQVLYFLQEQKRLDELVLKI